ncbi:MAG: rhomboid family intramembrane serine protease [Bacteroidales bacterium]|nr:rhomboid family intramembrane serine protease [Bacteroidales bacterium]
MIIIIIAITAIISFLAFQNRELSDKLRFNAFAIKHEKEGWRFFSYALVHADWTHLFINMFVLFSFGDVVITAFRYYFDLKGFFYFILLYVGGTIFSVLFDFSKNKENPYYNAVGASGAVSAVVFSSILIYPTGSVYLFLIPFPIPSAIFGILYLVYSAYMSKRAKDNIGHSAHFWGAVFGLVFTIILKPALVTAFFDQVF